MVSIETATFGDSKKTTWRKRALRLKPNQRGGPLNQRHTQFPPAQQAACGSASCSCIRRFSSKTSRSVMRHRPQAIEPCVYIYAYIYICRHNIHMCVCVCVFAFHVCACVCVCARVCACVGVRIHRVTLMHMGSTLQSRPRHHFCSACVRSSLFLALASSTERCLGLYDDSAEAGERL